MGVTFGRGLTVAELQRPGYLGPRKPRRTAESRRHRRQHLLATRGGERNLRGLTVVKHGLKD